MKKIEEYTTEELEKLTEECLDTKEIAIKVKLEKIGGETVDVIEFCAPMSFNYVFEELKNHCKVIYKQVLYYYLLRKKSSSTYPYGSVASDIFANPNDGHPANCPKCGLARNLGTDFKDYPKGCNYCKDWIN